MQPNEFKCLVFHATQNIEYFYSGQNSAIPLMKILKEPVGLQLSWQIFECSFKLFLDIGFKTLGSFLPSSN